MFWKKNQKTLFCFEEFPRESEPRKNTAFAQKDTDLKHGRLLPVPKQVIALPATKEMSLPEIEFSSDLTWMMRRIRVQHLKGEIG